MPSVFPSSDVPRSSVGFQPSHAPSGASASPSRIRRATARISAQVRSAVASVRTPGVFVTTIPRSRQAARSMWSVPTEQLATIRRLRRAARTSAVTRSRGVGRNASATARRCAISSSGRPARPDHDVVPGEELRRRRLEKRLADEDLHRTAPAGRPAVSRTRTETSRSSCSMRSRTSIPEETRPKTV